MKAINFFMFLCLFLGGCVNINLDKKNATLTGVLYESCNMKPVPNVDLELWVSGGGAPVEGRGKTNEKGEFSIQYTGVGSFTLNAIPASGGGFGAAEVMSEFSAKGDMKVKAYFRAETTVNVKVKTSRTLTQNDTLYIVESGVGVQYAKKYIAPRDGQLVLTVTTDAGSRSGFAWGIGYNTFLNNNNAVTPTQNGPFAFLYNHPKECGQTLEMTAEIK